MSKEELIESYQFNRMYHNKVMVAIVVLAACVMLHSYIRYRNSKKLNPNAISRRLKSSSNPTSIKYNSCKCLMKKECFGAKRESQAVLHQYTGQDISQCFRRISEERGRSVVLQVTGDTRLSQLLEYFPMLFKSNPPRLRILERIPFTGVKCVEGTGLSYEIKVPESSAIVRFLFRDRIEHETFQTLDKTISACVKGERISPVYECPHYFLFGTLLNETFPCEGNKTYIYQIYQQFAKKYYENLKELNNVGVNVLFKSNDPVSEFLFVQDSVEQAVYDSDTLELFSNLTLRKTSRGSFLTGWTSGETFAATTRRSCLNMEPQNRTFEACGRTLSLPPSVVKKQLQVLLNYMCNKKLFKDRRDMYCTN